MPGPYTQVCIACGRVYPSCEERSYGGKPEGVYCETCWQDRLLDLDGLSEELPDDEPEPPA